jgi:hypothetical protein
VLFHEVPDMEVKVKVKGNGREEFLVGEFNLQIVYTQCVCVCVRVCGEITWVGLVSSAAG